MKKLLFTISLFATLVITAQDGYKLPVETYTDIQANVSQLDVESARAFADRLAGTTVTPFAYLQTEETDKATKFYYSRSNLTQKEQIDQEEMGCANCLVVFFKNTPEGLTFHQVAGSFEDLLPTWQREFLSTATAENTKESFKYREVKNRTTGTDIRFSNTGTMWMIYNWSK